MDLLCERADSSLPLMKLLRERADSSLPLMKLLRDRRAFSLPLMKLLRDREAFSLPLMKLLRDRETSSLPLMKLLRDRATSSLPLMKLLRDRETSSLPLMKLLRERETSPYRSCSPCAIAQPPAEVPGPKAIHLENRTQPFDFQGGSPPPPPGCLNHKCMLSYNSSHHRSGTRYPMTLHRSFSPRRLGQLARLLALAVVFQLSAANVSPAGGGSLTDLELIPLASGLSDLVAITHAGDGRLFLSDKAGFIRIYDGAGVLATPFLDISALTSFGLEQGLLSVAFHPDYATNGFFYVFYADVATEPVIARYEVSAGNPNLADPASGVTVFSPAHFGGHYGGQLQFGPDGYLYFTLGDGGQQEDPECRAQDLSLLQGKMMRIDVDQNVGVPPFHGIPADNPFLGAGDPPDEIWAIGFRNPWRFSFDRSTGDLFISDVGQFTREEVSFQPAGSPGGENYGWKVMEGTFCFDPDPIDPDCPAGTASCFDPGYAPPIIEYDHSAGDCSITGGYIYRGSSVPVLAGHYVYGDWCTGNLWAASSGGGPWTSQLLTPSLPGVTTFGEGVDGELYVTDASTLYRLGDPAGIFADGFESGDLSSWSSSTL